MTHLTVQIQFPTAGIHAWEIESATRSQALHAAKELAGPDGTIIGWWVTPQREEWRD